VFNISFVLGWGGFTGRYVHGFRETEYLPIMDCLGIKGKGARIGVFAGILLCLLRVVCYILSYLHFHSTCPGSKVLDLLVVAWFDGLLSKSSHADEC
jgi:hypothetical protein